MECYINQDGFYCQTLIVFQERVQCGQSWLLVEKVLPALEELGEARSQGGQQGALSEAHQANQNQIWPLGMESTQKRWSLPAGYMGEGAHAGKMVTVLQPSSEATHLSLPPVCI